MGLLDGLVENVLGTGTQQSEQSRRVASVCLHEHG